MKIEKDNNHLHKIIDKFYDTVGIGESKELVWNFEKETHSFINPVKKIKHEKREKI